MSSYDGIQTATVIRYPYLRGKPEKGRQRGGRIGQSPSA
ncbi:hypothetical protein ABIE78_003678 [Sinorhizobium fredii]|uniref:Uncharacterized protein n=1 Tax=Sinorhizobium fredii (strain USDA 257) TaxID=1185652 RepID=I3X3S4_SINF2|nr:hypothetical protein USDA257_c19450 [Sinorhizobium fredii USDA 257]